MPTEPVNIAETLSRVLPKPEVLATDGAEIDYVGLPAGYTLHPIDHEPLLPNPRRAKAAARFSSTESFLAYVARHASESTVAWCNFHPQEFTLNFNAVIDEHAKALPGWRAHSAHFAPEFSAEWKAWLAQDRKSMKQVPFAEWLQEHEDDIAAADGLPTSLDMHKMATEFVANEERVLKSTVRLQDGGVRLTYIADPDKGTVESMRLFERFALGIPVFQGGPAWSITARLKYRTNSGAVSFQYELVRADRVHEGAAKELVEAIRTGLGTVPLLMGHCV